MRARRITIVLAYTLLLSKVSSREGSLRSLRDSSLDFVEPLSGVDVNVNAHRHIRDLQAVNSTKSLGTRSLFFVLVSLADSAPHSFTLEQWINVHFRNGTCFKTVIEGCSFGKLSVVSNGGINVALDGTRANYTTQTSLRTAAAAKANTTLGRDVYGMADHIVFCQPVNASSWFATGSLGGSGANWVNMHSYACTSLSILAHEFGHNLNLLHSSRNGSEYGDYTGMMGISYSITDGPKKCFNGYKNYQLRWYEDRHLNLYDFTEPRLIQLAAFADYDKTGPQHSVIINVDDLFFLQYNRAKGINSGTNIMRDLVTFTENQPSRSDLEGGLGIGGSLVRPHEGKMLFVSVCHRVNATTSDQPDVMEITIGYHKNWCDLL